jgi:hypothetical protein
MPVNPLFERSQFLKVVQRILPRTLDLSLDRDYPRGGPELLRLLCGIAFVRAELVEIIVVAHVVEAARLLGGAKGTLNQIGKRRGGKYGFPRQNHVADFIAEDGSACGEPGRIKELPSV